MNEDKYHPITNAIFSPSSNFTCWREDKVLREWLEARIQEFEIGNGRKQVDALRRILCIEKAAEKRRVLKAQAIVQFPGNEPELLSVLRSKEQWDKWERDGNHRQDNLGGKVIKFPAGEQMEVEE